MIVGIQGSRNFDDYAVFLKAMGTTMAMMEEGDDRFFLYSAGPAKTNSIAAEFINVSERGLKLRGIKAQLRKVPPSWIKQNMHSLNYFAFFSQPKETVSDLVKEADDKDIDAGIYRY